MSQVYLGVSSTPAVPTSFTTDVDGPVTPIANELIIIGEDTTDDNVNGIQTDGDTAGTVKIQLTNRFSATGTTTDAATLNLVTFTLDILSPRVYPIRFTVGGRVTADRATGLNVGDGIGYTLTSTFKTDGAGGSAVATRINTPFTEEDEDAVIVASQIDIVASGNTAILQVTGTVDFDIIWVCVGEYIKV